jgi:hypothetical protein
LHQRARNEEQSRWNGSDIDNDQKGGAEKLKKVRFLARAARVHQEKRAAHNENNWQANRVTYLFPPGGLEEQGVFVQFALD